jgi:hypothetical protein
VLPPFEPVSALQARPCGSVYAGPPAFTLITLLATLLNNDSGTDLEVPFKVATTEVVTGEVSAAAVTENPADVDPAGTVTDVGNVTPAAVVPSFSATVVPVLGAAADRLTVHAEVPGVGTVPGVHVTAVGVSAGGCKASEKLVEIPLRVATSTAVAAAETLAALAVKLTLLAPAAITTDVGIVTGAVVLPTPRVTVTGAVAAELKLIVHVALPGVTRVLGLHDIPEKRLEVAMVTVPPVADAFSTPAAADAACVPLT